MAFGSVPASSFSVVSPDQIEAVSPPGGAAPVDVTVTTPAGTSSTGIEDRFTYFASDPGAPSGVHATAGNREATVTFTAPSSNGSGIIAYTVTASPGGAHASGASSPITVTGLSNGTRYTFTVTATNGIGTGPASPASNAVTPEPPPPSASHVSIKRVGKRKPKLAFTITAGRFAQPLKSIAVTLPKGLSFSKSKHNQSKGITVKRFNGKPAKFASKVGHGVLTISLKSPGPKAQVVVASPELSVSKSFARKVKRKKAGKVTFGFKVSDKTHAMTKITSTVKIS